MSDALAAGAPPAAQSQSRLTIAIAALAGICFLIGLTIAIDGLATPPWMDEFNTYATTLRGHSLATFLAYVLRGQHPLLFEGPIYLAQQIGITDFVALRLYNFLGVPLALSAIWLSWRRGALTLPQAATIVALYASSTNFISYLGSLRPYFLVFSAAIATALIWRLMLRDDWRRSLWLWGAALAIFVNLHYFATLFGGLLTIGLIIARLLQRDVRGATTTAGISALAALPALLLGVLQAGSTLDSGTLYYFPPGLEAAFGAFGGAIFAAIAMNLPAGLAALAGLRAPRKYAAEFGLLGVVIVFFAILLILHLRRPMLFDRYLIAGAGAILVATAILAAGAHRSVALLICVYAIGVQAWTFAYAPRLVGWMMTAEPIARRVRDCPDTRVYTVPYARLNNGAIWDTPLNPTENEARRIGYRYYADRLGFSTKELHPGDSVSATGACPALIWIEHFWPLSAPGDLLKNLRLHNDGPARFSQNGSGVIVAISPTDSE